MSIIKITGLTKDYGNQKGIFDLTFNIEEGEIFGYLGPNGAGKTTTIRHLLGFLKPDKGGSQILGMDCRLKSAEIMKNLGYLPGEIAFFDGMKGMEFLNFMGEMKGLKDTSLRDRLVDMFQLDTKGRIRKIFILTFEDASSATDFINNSPFDIIEANNKTVKLGILGNVTELIKALDKYKVLDLDTEKSSLEDIFMHYYGDLNISQKSD